MRRFAKRLTLASVLVLLSSVAYSAGSYHKRTEPLFDHLVIAGAPHPPVTLPKPPQIDPAYMFGGCGRGRIRDLQTHTCHGPGDLGH